MVSRQSTTEMLIAFEADVVLLDGYGLVLRDCEPIVSILLRHCMPTRSQVDFIFYAFLKGNHNCPLKAWCRRDFFNAASAASFCS